MKIEHGVNEQEILETMISGLDKAGHKGLRRQDLVSKHVDDATRKAQDRVLYRLERDGVVVEGGTRWDNYKKYALAVHVDAEREAIEEEARSKAPMRQRQIRELIRDLDAKLDDVCPRRLDYILNRVEDAVNYAK